MTRDGIRRLWAVPLCLALAGWASGSAVAQPSNDNFENALEITGAGGSVTGSNEGATEQTPNEPIHYTIGGASVWFRWVAPKDGLVYFHTQGSSFDTLLAAYTGSALGNLVQIAANDDIFFSYWQYGLSSYISFEAKAGVTYYIAVDGFFGATGSYVLTWAQPGEAGVFNFTSPAYIVTESEGRYFFGRDNERDIPGAVITVNRLGGALGRALVDFYVTNTMVTNVFQTNIVTTNMGTLVTNTMFITNVVPSAEPYLDYFPTNGTLVFDHFQTSTNFVVPVGYSSFFSGNRTNTAVFATIYLTNARPGTNENPDLVAPVIGLTNVARLDILQIFDYRSSFSIERTVYRVDEYDSTVWVTIVLPGAGGGSVILETVDRANDYSAYFYGLQDGSDYADDLDQVFPNPFYTDGSRTVTNRADFVTYSQRITFGNNIVAREIPLNIIRNDPDVEFNEDILIILRDPQGDKGIFHGFATLTILYDEQPAGAADREWNPDNVTFTVPPYNLKPGANNEVFAVAVQGDQKAIIGGDFTAYNTVPRHRIARLNEDGSLDTAFNPGTGADGFVSAVLAYPQVFPGTFGKVMVGGAFSSINNIQRNGIARLNANGSLDPSFTPGSGFNGVVRDLSFMGNGKIVAVGDFTAFNGIERRGVARLNEDGSLDPTFNPGPGANNVVWAVGVDNVFESVSISAAQPVAGAAEFRTNIAFRASSGTVTVIFAPECVPDRMTVYYGLNQIFDSGWTNEYRNDLNCNPANFTGPITYSIPFGPGSFTNITLVVNEGGGNTNTLWWLDAFIDTFQPGTRVYVGGEFTSMGGVPRNGIARLNNEGALDATFDPGDGVDGPVFSLAVQSDLKTLIGGRFNTVDFRPRRSIARLNADGSLDLSFDPGDGANNGVRSIVLQGNGKPVIGGQFTTYDGVRRLGMARLFTNGVLDTSFMDTGYNQFAGLINRFSYDPPNSVNAIARQANDHFIIGGSFTTLGGNPSSDIVNNVTNRAFRFHYPVYTRQDKLTRFNVARILGGYTPGPGNASLAYSQYTADENGESLAITLRRFDGRLGTLRAVMQTTNRVAQEGLDYLAITNTPTWPEYAYNAPRSVGAVGPTYAFLPLLDDDEIEGDETLDAFIYRPQASITLGGGYYYYFGFYWNWWNWYGSGYRGGEHVPLGGARGRFHAPVTIVDNDFRPGILVFSQPLYSVAENVSEATITVIRTNGAVGAVSVDYFTRNGTATAGQDYLSRQGTLTFAPGQTNRTFPVTIINDLTVEPDETVLLVLTNASGGARLPGGLPTSFETATLSIVDDDFMPGRLNFARTNFTVSEAASWAEIIVTRTGGSLGQSEVRLSTSPGTAQDGLDYIGTNMVLTWINGDVSQRIVRIPIINEVPALVEGAEFFTVSLSNPFPPGSIGQIGSATVTIVDDDTYGSLAFSQPSFEGDENGETNFVTVVRLNGTAGTVSVNYTISDGTAVEGLDFIPWSGTLVFGPGETAKSFGITLLDDSDQDGDKTILLSLHTPTNATLLAPTTAFFTIIDNESFNAPAGSIDTTFDASAGPNGDVFALALQPDGKLIVAGEFTRLNNITKSRVGRLFANGAIDGFFSVGPGPNASVRSVALQPDGKILLGGFFTSVHGTNRNRIARLNQDGTVDTSFNPGAGADSPVFAVRWLESGKVVVGGAFATFNGIARPSIVLLNSNGSVDASFNPGLGANGAVHAVAQQRDGKILIAGDFTQVGGVPRAGVARLNPDGSVDVTFNPGTGTDNSVRAVHVQPDGFILIGGSFTSVGGVPRNFMARLLPNGDLDAGFLATGSGANDEVFCIAQQLDGKIVVVGDFTRFNGVTRHRITRLFPDGRTDPTINFGGGANSFISSVLVQPNRRLVIGGGFTQFNLLPRNRLARLHGGAIAGAGSVEFSLPSYTVLESVGDAEITVRRVGGTAGDGTVNFTDLIGSATPGLDYVPTNGSLLFLEGEVQQSFKVRILDDSLVEPDESLLLILSTNGSDGLSLGPQPVASLTILSDDSMVGFQAATFRVNENVVGGFASIAVERTGTLSSTISVDYATVGGTALTNVDYLATNGTLIFTNGQFLQTIRIPILDDALAEFDETILVALSNLQGSGMLGLANLTVTILDDDFGPGELSFTTNEYFIAENNPAVTLTILRNNGAVGSLTMNYFTIPGSATPDVDYAASTGVVRFGDRQTSQSFSIPIFNDDIAEGNESFFVVVSNLLGGATFTGPTLVRVTIVDDEFPLGTLDTAFDPGAGANALVRSLGLQATGKLIVGGAFTLFNNISRNFVTRLNQDGSHDLSFASGAGANGLVASVGVQSDDKIVLGGAFTQVDGVAYNRVARLATNGAPDTNYLLAAGFNASVNVLSIQRDNRVVVGGLFSLPTRSITQLRLNGSVDTSFNPGVGVNGPVHAVVAQPDGRVVIGGSFTHVDGIRRDRVARLNANGSLDLGFVPPSITNGSVFCLAAQSNGQVVLGGDFRLAANTNWNGLARLNANGSLDSGFQSGTGPNAAIFGLGLQSSGHIMVGGSFTSINGINRNRYGRLNPDGSVDLTFQTGSGANNTVYALLILPDDNIVIGGDFTLVNGVPRNRVARLVGAKLIFRITAITLGGGQARITLDSQVGRKYVLQASQDLVQWSPIYTNTAAGATLDLIDTAADSFTKRFYRVLTVSF